MDSTKKHITREEAQAFFRKILDDKKAIQECVSNNGDIDQVIKERGIQLANPIHYSE